MANFNLADGGDIHYNPNMAMYPQNAYIEGRPEFGWSTTILKPAEHWEGGHFAPVKHFNFGGNCTECDLYRIGKLLAQDDTFLTHIIPSMSLVTDFHYVIHTPMEGVEFEVRLAGDTSVVLGTIDASVKGDNWFTLADGGVYVPYGSNDGIEIVITAWPEAEEPTQPQDPCRVFGDCPDPVTLCFTATAFYKHARAEKWCEEYCYDNCMCG